MFDTFFEPILPNVVTIYQKENILEGSKKLFSSRNVNLHCFDKIFFFQLKFEGIQLSTPKSSSMVSVVYRLTMPGQIIACAKLAWSIHTLHVTIKWVYIQA